MFCSHFSTRPRSRDRTEFESSGLAADEPAEEQHPGCSGELEALCTELQAALEGLVRGRPSPGRAGQGPLLRLMVGLSVAGAPGPHGKRIRRVGVTAFQQSSIYGH